MPTVPQYGVQRSSIPGVLSWYDDQEETGFRIYAGRKENDAPYFVYNGKDKEEGYAALHKALSEMEPADYSIYFLKVKNSNPKVKEAPGVTFQLHSPQPQYGMPAPGYQANNEMLSRLAAIENKLDNDIEEEDDEEETEPQTPSSIIAGILQQPQVQSALITFVTNMAGNFMKPPTVQAVAGIVEDDVQKSIETLFSKGVTPSDLAKLAAMDKGQINFLLTMLRK